MRIEEVVIEPNKIYVESEYKIKIKIRDLNLEDIAQENCNTIKNFSVLEIKEG